MTGKGDMQGLHDSLTMLVYGPSKSGKSTLAATAPKPMLYLDVEKGARFLNIKGRLWDPYREAPPEPDDSWDTAIVNVNSYDTVLKAYQWLKSGKHPFKSVVVDSISELQAAVIDQLIGRDAMKMQQWGELLRHMAGFLRDLRDLTAHPTNPLDAVVVIAMMRDVDGVKSPYLQGQASVIISYVFDITGYLCAESYPHPDPTKPPYIARRLYIGPSNPWVSGERVGGRLGEIIEQDDLDIAAMISRIYQKGNDQ